MLLGALGSGLSGLGSSLLSGLGSVGGGIVKGLGSAGGVLKDLFSSAGGSGFGEIAKGVGGLLGAGSSMYGAYDQSKRAKDMMQLQKQMYFDWNNTRLGNQKNLAQGYNDVFGANNDFYKKKNAGMLNTPIY